MIGDDMPSSRWCDYSWDEDVPTSPCGLLLSDGPPGGIA